VEKLREVFAAYLLGVGRAILHRDEAESWADTELRDMGAALLGGVSGYRSFRAAAALPPGESTAEAVLALGIPEVIGQRQDDSSSS